MLEIFLSRDLLLNFAWWSIWRLETLRDFTTSRLLMLHHHMKILFRMWMSIKKIIDRVKVILWLRPQSDDDFKAPDEEEKNLSANWFHRKCQNVCDLLLHPFLCFIILIPTPSQRQARMVLQIWIVSSQYSVPKSASLSTI